MNNFAQKKIKYDLNELDKIPYSSLSHLKYQDNGKPYPAIRINDTFQQLVNNDLFLESELQNLSVYTIGPKRYDVAAIDAAANGYKVWQNEADSELSILRKVNPPLQDNLSCCAFAGIKVNYFCQMNGDTLVGTDAGIWQLNKDYTTVPVLDGIASYDYCIYNDIALFACEDGIYQANYELQSVPGEGGDIGKYVYTLNKRNKTYLPRCNAVSYNPQTFNVFAGTDDGAYYGMIDNNRTQRTIQFSDANLKSKNRLLKQLKVNDIEMLDHLNKNVLVGNDVVIATDGGLYQSRETSDVKNRNQIGALKGKDCTLFAIVRNIIYVASGNAAYSVDQELACKQIIETPTEILDLHAYNDDQLWLLSEGKLTTYTIRTKAVITYDINPTTVQAQQLQLRESGSIAHYSLALAIQDGKLACYHLDNGTLAEIPIKLDGTTGTGIACNCMSIVRNQHLLVGYDTLLTVFSPQIVVSEDSIELNLVTSKYINIPAADYSIEKIAIDSTSNAANAMLVCKNSNEYTLFDYVYDDNSLQRRRYITGIQAARDSSSVVEEYGTDFQRAYVVNDDINSYKQFAIMNGNILNYCINSVEMTTYNDAELNELLLNGLGTVNFVAFLNGKYIIGASDGVHTSEGNGATIEFYLLDENLAKTKLSKIIKKTPSEYLIASAKGLFTLKNDIQNVQSTVYKNSAETTDIQTVSKYSFNGIDTTYAYSTGNTVYSSSNAKKWNLFLTLDGVQRINCIYAYNKNVFYFATDVGLYATLDRYTMVNDVQKFTEKDARDAFDEISQQLDDTLSGKIMAHEQAWHYSATNVITYMNDNFSDVGMHSVMFGADNSTSSDTISDCRNDIVIEVEFGDQSTRDVCVAVSNFVTAVKQDLPVKFNYILKRYASGIVELFISIPTTYTYYISHVSGSPLCKYANRVVDNRKSLVGVLPQEDASFMTDVNGKCTKIDLAIDKAFFEITEVIDIQANGNSLPLKMYREDDVTILGAEQQASRYFHSTIKPTKLLTDINNIAVGADDYYHIQFACFGTDAQAIKLTAYDKNAAIGKDTYVIEYYPNGASIGAMSKTTMTLGKARKLKRNAFAWPQETFKIFAGWSVGQPLDDNSASRLADGQEVSDLTLSEIIGQPIEKGQTVKLYAVWNTYQFNSDDIHFVMQSNKSQIQISQVDVDESVPPNDLVVVDYGD